MIQEEQKRAAAEAAVEMSRRRLADVAGRSGAWVEEQKRRSGRRQELQSSVAPLLEEQQQLHERLRQERERLEELTQEQHQDGADGNAVQQQLATLEETWQTLLQAIANGNIDVAPLITGHIGIDGVRQAFEDLASPDHHAKILVEPWQD